MSPPPVRVSRLAGASLVVAVVCSPCVTVYYNRSLGLPFVLGAMAVATVLPVVAMIRIRRSRGVRRGFGVAAVALGVAVGWWCLVVAAWLLVYRDFEMVAPTD